MITSALVASIRQIVSTDYAIDDEDQAALYGGDGSGSHAVPGLVVLPGSEEEVVAVLRLLGESESPVTVRGAAGGLVGGAVPARGGIVISTARLNEPVRIVPEDGLVIAPAGARLHEIERAALRAGLTLGGPFPERRLGTIGGLVARNGDGTGGTLATVHGIVRGLRAAMFGGGLLLADGNGGFAGGNLRGAGLMIGGEGGLGVITEATLALRRRMPADRVVLATFEDPIVAAHAGAGLIAAGVSPLVADVADTATWKKTSPWPGGESDDGILLIWLTGLEADVDDEAAWVRNVCGDYMARHVDVLDEDGLKRIVPAWADVVEANRPVRTDVPLDLTVPVARIPELLETLYEEARDKDVPVTGLTRLASGVLTMRAPMPEHDDNALERTYQFVEALIGRVDDLQGSTIALHGVGLRRGDQLTVLRQQADLEAFRLVKQTFDPGASASVPVAPPQPKDRRDIRERRANEPRIVRIQEALVQQFNVAITSREPTHIAAQTAVDLGQVLRMAGPARTPVSVHGRPGGRLIDVGLATMDRVVMLDADSRVIVTEGGITVGALAAAAHGAGLWWPVGPLVARETLLSDLIAWDRADSCALGWGATSARIVGLEAVTGHGDVLSWGGLVPTQHGGLRLVELALGLRHRYAVTTAAALRLAPAPSMTAGVTAVFPEIESANRALQGWLGAVGPGEPVRCRPSAAWIALGVREDDPIAVPGGEQVRAFVEFAGLPASVERQVRWAKHIAEQNKALDIMEAFDAEAAAMWKPAMEIRQQWPGPRSDDALHLVIGTGWSAWPELARKVLHAVRVHGYAARMLMDMGAGRIDLRVERGNVEPAPLVRLLGDAVLRAKAVMELWSSPPPMAWIGAATPELEALRTRLKQRFDPYGVLPDGWGPRIDITSMRKQEPVTSSAGVADPA